MLITFILLIIVNTIEYLHPLRTIPSFSYVILAETDITKFTRRSIDCLNLHQLKKIHGLH